MRTTLRMRTVALLIFLAFFSPIASQAALQDTCTDAVMLQGFHWESHMTYPWWGVVQAKATDIAAAGFDMVWLPPSSASAAGADEGYLPNELYNLTSAYGDQTGLVNAINALDGQGVKAIADIVINHRVGTTGWADFTSPVWGADAVCGDDEWAGALGAPDTGAGFNAGRDVDHTKPYVRDSIIDWMDWLRSTVGYDGWRYDYTKGYGGTYNGIYDQATAPWFSVGEYWDTLDLANPNAHRQRIIDWIDATGGRVAAFDFTTKGVLQQAVAYNEFWRLNDGTGKPPGVIGWWSQKAVTFIDNHDTGPSTGGAGGQNHWPFPAAEVMQGYAYTLTHPGIPTVYWVHYFDWGHGAALDELIRVREEQGITSCSTVAIQQASGSVYAAIIDNRVAMKIGPGSWSPGAGWTLETSGTEYAVWSKTPSQKVRAVIYIHKETVPGQDIFIRGGHDAGLVSSGAFPQAHEAITYLNTLNATTAPVKAGDTTLDWGSDSALDWTTNAWPGAWGPAKYYAVDGYGEDPENLWGHHYWKFDVEMDGAAGDWFEFKAVLRQGSAFTWEGNISQVSTPAPPYSTINHQARKGYITVVDFGGNNATFYALP